MTKTSVTALALVRLRRRHTRTGRRNAQSDARSRLPSAILYSPEAAYDRSGIELLEQKVTSELAAYCVGGGATGIGAIPGGAAGPGGESKYPGGGGPLSG